VQRLAGLNPTVFAPGHGKPLAGADMPAKLRELSENFDRIAIPANDH
jgi:hypothetical protein